MAKTTGDRPFSWSTFLSLTILLLGALIVLLPLGVILVTSISPLVGQSAHWFSPYREAWWRGHFPRAFGNSTLVALAVTTIQLVTSIFAGYALARFSFWGRRGLLLVLLATLVIPVQLLVIPIFLILQAGQMINTYAALILPTAVSVYGIFLLRQVFSTLPIELEEAAALDGASSLEILWLVMVPLARPALVTLALLGFIGEWNDLFKPLIFTTRPELQTVQLALASFQDQFTNNWPLMMAAVVIATIPIVVLFIIGQKQLLQGIATTGLKG